MKERDNRTYKRSKQDWHAPRHALVCWCIITFIMQPGQCSCPVTTFQQISGQLEQDTLPIDRILSFGSEFTSNLKTITHCDRCSRTQRVINILLRITSRLVCFYEAAYTNASGWSAAAVSSSSSSTSSLSSCSAVAVALPTSQASTHSRTSPNSHHGESITSSETSGDDDTGGCQSEPRHMRLGNLTLQGSEAQLLGQIVLMDACLDLIDKLQEWKLVMDEQGDETSTDSVHDEVITGCLDRLAKLTGLLHFGDLSTAA